MKIQGYKVVELTVHTWAVIVPGWHRDYIYMVTEHFDAVTVVDSRGLTWVELPTDENFAEIEKEAEELPLDILRIILKSYLNRHLR